MKKIFAVTLFADVTVMTPTGFQVSTNAVTTVTAVVNGETAEGLIEYAQQDCMRCAKEQMPEADGWSNHRAQMREIGDETLIAYLLA